jgi:hypothetical protein
LKQKIWTCKIGEAGDLPEGSDRPMREAVTEAYRKLTGKEPNFCFSGWGGQLSKIEREVAEEYGAKDK